MGRDSESLANLPPGRRVVVDRVAGPDGTVRRLAEMGIRPGSSISVLYATAGGGRILGVEGARIAVDRVTADSIGAHHAVDA